MRNFGVAGAAIVAFFFVQPPAQAGLAISCGAFDTPGAVTPQEIELVETAFKDSLAESGLSVEIASFLNERFYHALACKAAAGRPSNKTLADTLGEQSLWSVLDRVPMRKGKSEAILDILALLRQTQAQQSKPAPLKPEPVK
ncbi:hypothetical protein [Oricola sp.]|uniref:hypothetical protein n=1 Tax=Oricola sp. TaxID=1979950 RepID=UPI0025CBDDE1|nr:hypothetical protein [Oricola sp.]MCI5078658.1 hypothetical protein [Oricola sp.]